MSAPNKLFELAIQLESIAQAGRTYCDDPFCQDRYDTLSKMASELYGDLSHSPAHSIYSLLLGEIGYPTPKLDVRGALIENNKIFLVQERQDGCWTLPGGWADLNDSPSESVRREFLEETSIAVETTKLIALFDKLKHGHPPQIPHAYKCFFLCEKVQGQLDHYDKFSSIEISQVAVFDLDNLPTLSLNRVTAEQVELCFKHYYNFELPTEYD